jgi:hypothetical protein
MAWMRSLRVFRALGQATGIDIFGANCLGRDCSLTSLRIKRVPVFRNGRVVGIASRADLIREL